MNTASCKPEAVGYCISKDRYLKRDELGAVFQLCVAPGKQRSFIGANLLREVFERAAYGCKLFCCWCAQDLAANKFWEAMGFVPIAYRAGGKARGSQPAARSEEVSLKAGSCKLKASPRIHIFWQKRIRANDVTTPYWFPAKTEGGAIREDRIILPIPLAIGNRGTGMRWWEELPVLVGEEVGDQGSEVREQGEETKRLPGKKKSAAPVVPKPVKRISTPNGIWRSPARTISALPETPTKTGCSPREKRVKAKADPKIIAKARELRDRWMEHVAENGNLPAAGRYDVCRIVDRTPATKRIAA